MCTSLVGQGLFSLNFSRLNITRSRGGLKKVIQRLTNDTEFIRRAETAITVCLKAVPSGDHQLTEDQERVFIFTCLRKRFEFECFERKMMQRMDARRQEVFVDAEQQAKALNAA